MARKPIPGSDGNNWGSVLNEYLDALTPSPGEVIVGGANGPVAAHRAFLEPVTDDARFRALPVPMATSPTLTLSAAAATTALTGTPQTFLACKKRPTSNWYDLDNLDKWRYAGEFVTGPTVEGYSSPIGQAVAGRGGSGGFRVEAMTDSPKLEILFVSRGGKARLLVDGAYASGIVTIPASGGIYRWLVDFTQGGSVSEADARKPRLLELEVEIALDGASGFHGFTIGERDRLWRPDHLPLGPTVIVMGDSYVQHGSAAARFDTFVQHAARLLGWRNVWPHAFGGTGWATDSAFAPRFRGRVAADILPYNPDIVLFWGSQNDLTADQAFRDDVRAALQATRSGLPDTVILTTGPQFPTGNTPAHHLQQRDIIAEETAAVGGVFIGHSLLGGPLPYSGNLADYLDRGWMTGTGSTSAPSTGGNASVYNTNNHVNAAGSPYYGYRLAQALAGAMIRH